MQVFILLLIISSPLPLRCFVVSLHRPQSSFAVCIWGLSFVLVVRCYRFTLMHFYCYPALCTNTSPGQCITYLNHQHNYFILLLMFCLLSYFNPYLFILVTAAIPS